MKQFIYFLILNLLSIIVNAQVQIKPLPSSGFEKRIKTFIDNLPVVDTHEHLVSPEILKTRGSMDFMLLLQHYSAYDIISSGLTKQTFDILLKDSLAINEKWKILQPYWEGSSNTAYNRTALLAADKLFGINDINEKTIELLSSKIKQANQSKEWPEQVFKKGNLDFIIQDVPDPGLFVNERFRFVIKLDDLINLRGQSIKNIENKYNISIKTLDNLVEVIEIALNPAIKEGRVAIKSTLAYTRILHFENTSREEAQKVFDLLTGNTENKNLSFEDTKPLQDYMMHRILDKASEKKIPLAIHTGLHAGNGNIIGNSNPAHLVNLFLEYPDVNFVLFHGGYPFGGELSALAKNFRNVYIDLCWLYVISPSYSERYLHEWLETVPASKIMGFGGDYKNIENMYAHLLLAKQIVTKVLTEKVRDGYFSELEATKIAKMIFYDNAIKFYNLSP